MKDAIRKIAVGYLLLYLDFSLGTLQLLPNWGAYLLFLGVLGPMGEKRPSAKLLRPFAVLLALWEAVLWFAKLFGSTAEFWLPQLVAGVLALYFHFQFLTDLAAVAEEYGWEGHRKLLHLRTVHTLLTAFLTLPLPWEKFTAVTVLLLLVNLAVLIWIIAVLFGLKNFIQEQES